MIAVTGASGHLGHLVIKSLLKKTSASNIIAIVRNPSKAEDLKKLGVTIRKADYDQADNWESALEGVKKLLLISSSEVGKRTAQHTTVLNAARKVGLQQIAYTSILRADSSKLILAQEHLATEKLIRESGILFTILRNGWYLENHTENLAPALEHGAIHGAAKNGKFSSAARADYAEAAAIVLTSEGHTNKIYELAGDASFTLADLASVVSKKAGRPVAYRDDSFNDYKNFLVKVGVPDGFATVLADSDLGASKSELYSDSKDLSRLIGHPTTSLDEAVNQAIK